MKKLFTRFGKFAIVLIALDLAVAITIIACSALFLTGCGDEYILPEEIRERELAELEAFEPYIDEDGMVHVSPWFAYHREVVEIKDSMGEIKDPRELVSATGLTVYTLLEEELIDNKLMVTYRVDCDFPQHCHTVPRIYIYKCWGDDVFSLAYIDKDYTDLCRPEEGRY